MNSLLEQARLLQIKLQHSGLTYITFCFISCNHCVVCTKSWRKACFFDSTMSTLAEHLSTTTSRKLSANVWHIDSHRSIDSYKTSLIFGGRMETTFGTARAIGERSISVDTQTSCGRKWTWNLPSGKEWKWWHRASSASQLSFLMKAKEYKWCDLYKINSDIIIDFTVSWQLSNSIQASKWLKKLQGSELLGLALHYSHTLLIEWPKLLLQWLWFQFPIENISDSANKVLRLIKIMQKGDALPVLTRS